MCNHLRICSLLFNVRECCVDTWSDNSFLFLSLTVCYVNFLNLRHVQLCLHFDMSMICYQMYCKHFRRQNVGVQIHKLACESYAICLNRQLSAHRWSLTKKKGKDANLCSLIGHANYDWIWANRPGDNITVCICSIMLICWAKNISYCVQYCISSLIHHWEKNAEEQLKIPSAIRTGCMIHQTFFRRCFH